MSSFTTFRQIEEHLGIKDIYGKEDSSLERWYKSVRNKSINNFSDEDLCKACRQQLYLEFIIPYAIDRIELNPLAGEMYDGELLVALSVISKIFWATQTFLAQRLHTVITHKIDTNYGNVIKAIQTLKENLLG